MKKEIRKQALKKQREAPKLEVHQDIFKLFDRGCNIGAYAPINNELKVDKIYALDNVYLPYMRKVDKDYVMEYHKYSDELLFDDLNVLSSNGKNISINELDVILIPGLSYNYNGYRIGYGKGCYDKSLKDYRGLKIGICLDSNVIDDCFEEVHDIKVDYIVSEKRVIKVN